jgi:hypothetical protein
MEQTRKTVEISTIQTSTIQLTVKLTSSNATIRHSVYQVAGNVMGILTVLEKKMKKVAMRQNVKIGNSIVEKDNVFLNLGDAMAKKIVPQDPMNKTAPILCLMKVPNWTVFLIFHTFRIPHNVMNGLLNVQMVNVFRTGGNVTAAKTVLTKVTSLNVKILMILPNTLMMTTKTMIQVGLQLVLRISFCVLEVRTVFGRPGFVTTRTIVPAARTNPRKSVQIDLFVTKTCSGVNNLVNVSIMSKYAIVMWIVLMALTK